MSLTNDQVRATVAVSDMGRAKEFYEGKLGLTPLEGGPDMVSIYPCGGGSQLQVYVSEHAGGNAATAASWTASDFDGVIGDLRSKGVTFETYEGLDADDGVHVLGSHRVVWFKDPDGNVIAVDNGSTDY
jgi:catechol 2,3-dioxygenase-like lactoylglutathione lyase family enzyme